MYYLRLRFLISSFIDPIPDNQLPNAINAMEVLAVSSFNNYTHSTLISACYFLAILLFAFAESVSSPLRIQPYPLFGLRFQYKTDAKN